MQCCVRNVTNNLRCLNKALPGLNMCGVHRARTAPHELQYYGEDDTVYRDPDFVSTFTSPHKKVIYDASREPQVVIDPAVAKPHRVMHPFIGLKARVRYFDNKIYYAKVKKVMRHTDNTYWCHLVYSNDGATQDVRTDCFKIKNNMLTLKF